MAVLDFGIEILLEIFAYKLHICWRGVKHEPILGLENRKCTRSLSALQDGVLAARFIYGTDKISDIKWKVKISSLSIWKLTFSNISVSNLSFSKILHPMPVVLSWSTIKVKIQESYNTDILIEYRLLAEVEFPLKLLE